MCASCGSWCAMPRHVRCSANPVDKLFESLSYCAALHPSLGAQDGDDSGNPFAGIAPFGSGSDKETGRVRSDWQTPDARYQPY